MHGRELTRAEWSILQGTPLEVAPQLCPPAPRLGREENARIVVVEHLGRIVGHWAVLKFVHVEGVWTHPDHQKRGVVGGMLMEEMSKVARDWDAPVVWTAALPVDAPRLTLEERRDRESVAAALAHLGAKAMPPHFVFKVPECR